MGQGGVFAVLTEHDEVGALFVVEHLRDKNAGLVGEFVGNVVLVTTLGGGGENFVGALAGKKAGKGIFITTSEFHDNARDYAAGIHQKVILIDGRRLAELMIEHGIGVAEEHAYSVKKIDSDYFDEA